MRAWMIFGWLLLPVLVGAYHFGPGQERLQLDRVAQQLSLARQHQALEKWLPAVKHYQQALAELPENRSSQQRRIRLELAKTQMLAKQLPEANQSLKRLLDELLGDDGAEPRMLAETRSALASSQYYLTWLMRLEGLPRQEWEPEIENARQLYRLLAQQCQQLEQPAAATRHQEDLEAAIRLARMDLRELQGLPLPSQ